MALAPLTRCVIARWDRPRYELLDSRGLVIGALEGVGDIAGFAPSHDTLDVRFDDGRQVQVNLGGVTVIESVGSSDPLACRDVIAQVANKLGATEVTVTVVLQHLVEWAGETDDLAATRQAADVMVGVPGATDCAILFDGDLDLDWKYQAEFGVVSAAETPARLARSRGRSIGPTIDAFAEAPASMFPLVSTFVDSYWMMQRPLDVGLVEDWEQVAAIDEHAARLVETLHTRLTNRRKG
ncbi:UNVERIFIED_CONTAM: hypothetical protein DES50_107130 [Williamsia faeni]